MLKAMGTAQELGKTDRAGPGRGRGNPTAPNIDRRSSPVRHPDNHSRKPRRDFGVGRHGVGRQRCRLQRRPGRSRRNRTESGASPRLRRRGDRKNRLHLRRRTAFLNRQRSSPDDARHGYGLCRYRRSSLRFLAVQPIPLMAAVHAMAFVGVAGEWAAERAQKRRNRNLPNEVFWTVFARLELGNFEIANVSRVIQALNSARSSGEPYLGRSPPRIAESFWRRKDSIASYSGNPSRS